MSLCALNRGNRIKIGASEFLILQRLPEERWQLQNSMTGEWCIFDESGLLDRFTRNELSFVVKVHGCDPTTNELAEKLNRDLASYAPWLIALASKRVHYLKEIDGRQPIFDGATRHSAAHQNRVRNIVRFESTERADGLPGLSQVDIRWPGHTGYTLSVFRSRQTRYANAAGGKGDQ